MAGSVMGPGALFFWLQRENALFHVRVNAAVGALPAVAYVIVVFIVGTPVTGHTINTHLLFCGLLVCFS